MRAERLLRTAALAVGSGYVLFFFSERMFWSLWRPGDDIGIFLLTWLLYSFFAYLLLATVRYFRARSVWALFLSGASFGWLVEGVYAMTMFGDTSVPFPLTIVWTALAWHAPISVVIGWYALRRALQAPTLWPSLRLSLAIGVFWGFWAVAWAQETPPVVADPLAFVAYSTIATALLGLSQQLIAWGQPDHFRPSTAGLILAFGIVLAWFGLVTVPAIPWSPALIVPLLALLFFALWRNRAREQEVDALARLAGGVPLRNLTGLAAMPLAATAVYSSLRAFDLAPPSHHIVWVVTSAAGAVLFAVALVKLSTGAGLRVTHHGFRSGARRNAT